jgi:class 3 adenylate cyclase
VNREDAGVTRNTTVTVLFCDLVASTARFARIGDDAADAFLLRFRGACTRAIESHHGQVVKHLGDGVMAVFTTSSLDALLAACDLHTTIPGLDVDDPPRLRVGVSVGDVSESDGDWFGTPVIEASRLCDAAGAGETFTTSTVRAVVGSRGGLSFVDIGRRELKGLSLPVDVVRSSGIGGQVDTAGTETASTRPARGTRSRRRRLVVAAVAVALVAIAVPAVIASSASDEAVSSAPVLGANLGYRPTYEKRPCPTQSADGQKQQPIEGQTCGLLHVPERRDRPKGRQDQVVVHEFEPVSPGAHVTVMIDAIEPADDPVPRSGARLFQLIRRGEAGEPILTCPEMVAASRGHLDEPLNADPAISAHLTAVATCAARWDQQRVDRSAYGARDVANDVRDLVIARTLPPVDLVVASEDTPVALDLMRDEPEILRTVTFENPIPPTTTSADYIGAFAEAVDNFAPVCKKDPRCSKYLPNPVGAWTAMYHRLRSAPQLISGPVPDGSTQSVLIDGDRAALVFATAIGIRALTPFVPQTIASGDLQQMSYNAWLRSGVEDKPYGQDLTDLCERVSPNDLPSDSYVASLQPEYAVGIWNLPRLGRTCRAWKVTPDSDRSRQSVTSNIPVLVVGGALATTLKQEKADDMGVGFTRKVTFRFPTLGFGALHDAPSCFQALRRAWLQKPTSAPGRSQIDECEKSSPAIGFYG